MPAHLVRQAYDDGMTGLDNLAAKFDVSLHAMAITLAKLYRWSIILATLEKSM